MRFAYENLDRFIQWSVDDYFAFDDDQRRYVDASIDAFLYWHRTNELPQYARALRRFERDVRDGLSSEELAVLESEINTWGERVTLEVLPFATEVLYSTTAEQRAELAKSMPRESEKYVRSMLRKPPAKRRERWRREVIDVVENYVGPLTDDQKRLVAATSERYLPDDELWLDYRRSWQAELMRLLATSGGYGEFAARFRAHALERERWYGEAYADAFEANQKVYRAFAIELLSSLDATQRTQLARRLLDLADDFDELAGDAGEPPLPPDCLVSCSVSIIEREPRDDVRDDDDLRHPQRREDRRDAHPERIQVETARDTRAYAG
jgi:hypothetical protein